MYWHIFTAVIRDNPGHNLVDSIFDFFQEAQCWLLGDVIDIVNYQNAIYHFPQKLSASLI